MGIKKPRDGLNGLADHEAVTEGLTTITEDSIAYLIPENKWRRKNNELL